MIAGIIVTWVLDPFHPIRKFLGSIVQPLLVPIRRLVPPVGGVDLRPLILLIGLNVVRRLVLGVLA